MKCIKITLLHAFLAFNCFGMQADSNGDAYDVRSGSAIKRFMALINKDDFPVRGLLPVDRKGEPVEATGYVQRKIKEETKEYLSLLDAKKENFSVSAALIEATGNDKIKGICHTTELLESLINIIQKLNMPLLVTINSFDKFCAKFEHSTSVRGTCFRIPAVMNGKTYFSSLAVLIKNEESEIELASPESGLFENKAYFASDALYHELFHANAVLLQHFSHLARVLPVSGQQLDLAIIAKSLGIPFDIFSKIWRNDLELHCIAGVFLDSTGKIRFDPLCENSRLLRTKGGIALGYAKSIVGEESSIVGNFIRLYRFGNKVIRNNNGEFTVAVPEGLSYLFSSVKFAYEHLFPRLGYEGLSIPDILNASPPVIGDLAFQVFSQIPYIEGIKFKVFESDYESLRSGQASLRAMAKQLRKS
ncbi:MAG: hypothetical protein LBJ96_04350 [Holosporaceae bacterium]|nr:hypothetical protein [Holosporaceae bacterium]